MAHRQRSTGCRFRRRAHRGIKRVGRFGWKADVATIDTFVAQAFRNELGITSAKFPRDVQTAETSLGAMCPGESDSPEAGPSLIRSVTAFIESLQPLASHPAQSDAYGAQTFAAIGCAECHATTLRAGSMPLYSDLLLHDMGAALDDGFEQGDARGRDWRTTPLLGLASRKRFLHDGRAQTVAAAIAAHDGEAAPAAQRYRGLDAQTQRAVIAFVRRL